MEKIIYCGTFGSSLYGTSLPGSDKDYKQIHKSSLKEIVLKHSVDNIDKSTNRKTRNTSEDVDFESKELRQFILDCLNGQTYAYDMLFTPEHHWIESSPEWKDLITNRSKLLTKNIKPFIGYCKQMSIKYSQKADKLKSLNRIFEKLNSVNPKFSINDFFNKFPELLAIDFVSKYEKKTGKGEDLETYYGIVKGDYPGNRQIAEIIPAVELQIKNYGERVRKSLEDGSIDLKAYYHALRIAWELEDYLTTGEIVFPSKRVQTLIDIRLSKFSNDYVEKLISDEISRILLIPNNLPEADYEYWDNWIVDVYLNRKFEQ